MAKDIVKGIEVETSFGIVFADLGLADAGKLSSDFANLSERKLMDCLNRLS